MKILAAHLEYYIYDLIVSNAHVLVVGVSSGLEAALLVFLESLADNHTSPISALGPTPLLASGLEGGVLVSVS